MIWETIATYAVIFCLLIGAGFSLIASIALLKFNDNMTRLHAPTKVGTLGIGALLLASMINSFINGHGALHEALIMGFLFMTAPITANFLGKVNIHRRDCALPPPPLQDDVWSSLNVPEPDLKLNEQTDI